jgi:DnaJ-class molecular chaperone
MSYYREVLGVEKDADPKTIKTAFYAKSKLYHPDIHPGDKIKYQKYLKVTEAYNLLTNDAKSTDEGIRAKMSGKTKFHKGSVSVFFYHQ